MKSFLKLVLTSVVFFIGINYGDAKPRVFFITGPTSCGQGSTVTYTFDGGTLYTGGEFLMSTPGGGGNVGSTTVSGTQYSANITWPSGATSGVVYFGTETSTIATLNVTLFSCAGTLSPTNIINGALCGSGSMILSATAPTDYRIRWYDTCCPDFLAVGPLSGTSGYQTPSLSTTTTYNVTAVSSTNGCESARVTVTAAINPIPAAPSSATGGSVCGSGSVSLSAVAGANGNTVRWYSASTGGTPIATGLSYAPTVSSTTTYYVSTFNSTTNCESTGARVAVTATVYPTQVAPSVTTPSPKCGSGTFSISATPGAGGSTVFWYAASSGGSSLYTGTTYTTPLLSATTTYYAATSGTGGCISSARTAVTATINPVPAFPPSTTDATVCYGSAATMSAVPAANANTIRWYNLKQGGTLLATNTSYTVSVTSSTTYWVNSYNSATGCESSPAQGVSTNINPQVSVPSSTTGGSVCSSGSMILSAAVGANGNTIRWYSSSSGGTPLYTGLAFTTPSLSTTTTYYASSYNSSTLCESGRVSVVATVNPFPGVPTAASSSPTKLCVGGSVTLSATPGTGGTSVKWYTVSSGGTALATPTASLTVTTTYYAASVVGNCYSSTRTPVTVPVNPEPLPTGITATGICVSGSSLISALPGANGDIAIIYDGFTANSILLRNLLTPSSTYSTPTLTSSTTYAVASYNSTTGCETAPDDRVGVTAIVSPVAPTAALAVGQSSFCSGGSTGITITNPNNVAGTVLNWTATPASVTGAANGSGASGTIISQALTSTSGGTVNYSVTASANGCTSAPVSALITVNPIPSLPTSVSSTSVCGPGNVTFSATPGANANTTMWFDAASGGSMLLMDVNYTAMVSGPVTYYVDSYNTSTGCFSGRSSITATPIPLPPLPVAFAASPIISSGTTTLYANASDYGNNFINRWYTASTGGTPTPGSSYTTPTLTAANPVTSYFVSIYNNTTTCEGPRQQVNAVVLPPITPMSMTKFTVRTDGVLTDDQLYALTNAQADSTLIYLDGLQRPVQRVDKKASPQNYDIVTPVEYDGNGRTSKDYLPYASLARSGKYEGQYQTQQASFYTAANDKIANDATPFALASYEQSPLGRLTEQGAPGAAWQPGSGHSQKLNYSFNTGATASAGEEVRLFKADGTSSGFYAANTLARTQVTDANGHLTISYTDGAGHTLAKKQQLDNTISGVMVNFLETYYIYNDLGQLAYIMPPKAVAQLKSASWVVSQAFFDTWCFRFTYDYRGRLTQKKSPGQAAMYIAYDILNRPVLTQTGILRAANQWLFVKYDVRNRPVMTGIYTDIVINTLASIQTLLNGLYTSGNATYPPGSFFETKGSVLHGYTNTSFPQTQGNGAAITVQNVSYYDNYDFDNNGSRDFKYDSTQATGTTSMWRAAGLSTGGKSLILTTGTWLYNYVFYDKYGRTIQVRSNNHLRTAIDNLTTVVYDPLTRLAKFTKTYHNAGGTNQITVVQTPTYDAKGRVIQVAHKIGTGPTQVVAQYQYNELGQAVAKQLHQKADASFMQTVDLRYNIRGWLTSINNAQLASDGGVTNNDTNDYFGMELMYEATDASGMGNTSMFNGNVSAIKWKGAGAASGAAGQRSYKFNYDKSDQMLSASFQKSNVGDWLQEQNTLNETMSYDHNGNVLALQRNQLGADRVSIQTIDNLTYTYASGNQLSKVDDAAANTAGFNDGSNTATEYNYDTHGNLTKDLNKGISAITYNQLGKALQITFTNGNIVAYMYDAGGNKLKMTSTVSGVATITNYVKGFVYNTVGTTSTLNFFSSPEGRVIKNGSAYEYQYAIADHQGNTRVLFTSAAQTAQATTATFETANQTTEATQFQNYPDASHINVVATNAHTGSNSIYLNGAPSGQVGVTKSYKVFPGDQVQIQAYAKYLAPTGTASNLAGFASALLAAFNLPAPAPGEFGTPAAAVNNWGGLAAGGYGDGTNDQSDPKVFATIVIFDKNYNFLDVAYQQLTSSGSMNASYTVKEAGYAFMYISNEQQYQTDVYFDDVTMTYTPGNVLQSNEFYPFGMNTNNSWTRDNTTNNFLYDAGNELNNTTGMYDLPYRNYDAALGRFFQVDPLAHRSSDLTPYHYAGNNPIGFNDPTGLLKALPPQGSGYPEMMPYQNFWQSMGSYFAAADAGMAGGGGSGIWMTLITTKIDGWWTSDGRLDTEQDYDIYNTVDYFHIDGQGNSTYGGGDLTQSGITVLKYQTYNSGDLSGLSIRLGFNGSGSNLTDFRWVQTIRTNRPNGEATSPYNDPQPPDDKKPFYYTDAENSQWINTEGFDAVFSDRAKRFNNDGDVSWQAELSVVGKNSDGFYVPITTINYGFQIQNGALTINPIQYNVTPSTFQLNSFMNIKW